MNNAVNVFKDSHLGFIAPRRGCFNHHSVIENYFYEEFTNEDNSLFVKRYTNVGDIQHGSRVNRDHIRNLTKEEIMKKFQNWRQNYHDFPILLHAHGFNSTTGKPIYGMHGQWEKTWQALTRFDSNRNIDRVSKALEQAEQANEQAVEQAKKALKQAVEQGNESGVFLTLTVDRSKSLRESWETIMKDWHTFEVRLKIEIRRAQTKNLQLRRQVLRQRLKDQKIRGKFKNNNNLSTPFSASDRNKIRSEIKELSRIIKEKIQEPVDFKYFGTLESQSDGYPHIHVVFMGISWLFHAGRKKEYENDNPHTKNLKHFWKRGSIYIEKTKTGQKVQKPLHYIMKYIRKTMGPQSNDSKAILTQAMLWAFNRRSFFLSRSFSNWVKEVIPEEPKEVDWKLHGMANTEFWTGQKTPLVRIITRRLPEDHPALETQFSPMITIEGVVGEIWAHEELRDYLYHKGEVMRLYEYGKSLGKKSLGPH